ncbi:MAG: arsenic efflux protein [Rhodobacteraceae bacterium]|nr:arsenic efflux protein [Paracoccaceae bacterium]
MVQSPDILPGQGGLERKSSLPAATSTGQIGPFRTRRLVVVLALLVLAVFPGELGTITRGLMTDAYVQVSSFVAATLLLFYGAERVFRFDIGNVLRNARGAQVPIAAMLGATPGCGGAVVVVAAYSSGNVGFGAVVAALTATMGDAAFLLIATRPDAAAVVLPLSFGVGILSGWVIDWFVRTDFRTPESSTCDLAPLIGKLRARDIAYLAVALPGLVMGVSQLLQIDLEATYGMVLPVIGLAGTAVGLFVWSTSALTAMTHAADHPLTRMAEETSFISIWVIGAYLAYDYVVVFTGLDLAALFSSIGILLPLIAIAIGFIPGCGPQVLVTTLYINGLIPFAALIGNAISNDGDALFPAIALNPKVAFLATLVSAVPAVLVAYAFHFLAPGFL